MADKRERWGGRLPFIMAAVGSAVGLGNVWRFPAVAYTNGGGAFLVPYFIALITAGIPLMVVEYTLGQKYQTGAPGALARVNRRFRWVGWFALLVGSVISFYYVVIMAHAWHYSIASATLEWTKPAPVRVEAPLKAEQPVIAAENVRLFLKYEDDEHKAKLEEVTSGTGVAVLGELQLKKHMKEPETEPKPAAREYYLSLDEKTRRKTVRLENVALYMKPGKEDEVKRHKKLASGVELLTLDKGQLDKRIKEDEKKESKGPAYYVSAAKESEYYVSLDKNTENYFNEVCLGGYAEGHWREYSKHNAGLDKQIRVLEKDKQKLVENKEISDAERSQRMAETEDRITGLAAQKIDYRDAMLQLPWKTALWCGVTWLAIFLIIFKGVHVVGKVVMWTVSLPVVLLVILLIRGITLEGSTAGILYYLTPTWEKLADPGVWLAAYGQVFFSLSLGFGILIAYASYKPEDADITTDAFITTFADAATSFFAAFAVFSVLGYLATINKTTVDQVLAGGPGLVFVTYPIAIAKIGGMWGSIVGVIFFACLLLLGIDSAFSIVEAIITGIRDRFPNASKSLITAAFCLVGFCCSLVFATSSGMMWLDIVDNWMSKYGLVTVGLLECVAVAYFFHHHEIEQYANKRSDIHLGGWFELFIKYITPAILVFLLGAQFTKDMGKAYGGYDQVLPWSVTVAGWGVFVALVTVALALGRNWTKFLWLVSAGVVFGLFWLWLRGAEGVDPDLVPQVAAMGAVGVVLLFGGFFTCLRIALRHKTTAPTAAPEEPALSRE